MKRTPRAPSLLALLVPFFTSCASQPHRLPEDLTRNDARHDLETIVIGGINDIHGALAPLSTKTKESEGLEPRPYSRGGAAVFASHVKTLRAEFGNRFLLLDAGDCFQGSIDSNAEEGAPMVRFYNALGMNATAVGNHEFDFGPVGKETTGDPLGALKARMQEAHYPFLAANIVDRKTGKTAEFPNTSPHKLFTVGRVKVGVIGLSTLDTPVTTRADFVAGLRFTSLREATLREAKSLREAGAQIVLITAHVGLKCHTGKMTRAHTFRKAEDPQGDCEPGDEMVELLHSLPEGTVDAVVSGHSHTIVHHWVAGTPVIQGGTRNQNYNLMYLTYDFTLGKVLPERARIEGPIPICEKVFENQGDCDGDRPAPKTGRGDLVTPRLHGVKIRPDPEMEQTLAPIFAQTEALKKRIVGVAARPLDHVRQTESPLGNLVADALRAEIGADVALMNAGGIRAPIDAGPITYEALFRTFPFDNVVSEMKVTGAELKAILRVAESGSRGFFPTSGVRIRAIELGSEAPSDDLDQNGKIDPWEVNRIIDVTFADGTPIQDAKAYRLATIDFLVTGGDDLGWAMKKVPAERVRQVASGPVRDVVEKYIAAHSPVNSEGAPLLQPEAPRLKLEKPVAKTGKKSRKRSRRKKH